MWFVLKCQSSPAVILRPFRNGSEPQPSQPIVYVRFDRADAMEPIFVDVKCTYHLNSSRRSAAGAIFPPSSSRLYACASPGLFKPPGCFILSRFVCIGPELSARGWFVACACSVYRVSGRPRSGCGSRRAGRSIDPGEVKSV